jgi:hypothetical protein
MAFLVKVHFEGETQRRTSAKNLDNLAGDARRIDQVLAVKFIINFKYVLAQRPIYLPLRFRLAAENSLLTVVAAAVRSAETPFAG